MVSIWRAVDEFARDHQGAFPILFGGMDLPAKFEDIGMVPVSAIDLANFLVGFFWVAEFEPALRGDGEM
jgi:hypothetical protein